MNDHEIVKRYLSVTPVNHTLPKNWEIKFGRTGRFMQYRSVEHCESKHVVTLRNGNEGIHFGFQNPKWEKVKSNLQVEDQLWIWGNEGSMSVLHVRDDKIIDEVTLWIA